eukprot:CAMPEP_0180523978 /NCGR_PEP_ID=MMETSP1036_2-20121128/58365_1 /TAXON_ID=632150 /ORGANISM="Azadinium spinosum, Strain 3D9" /LENGTH=63 /DNA_ID=CAMNT_0022537131 /DNA_START=211 /DNA_END=402 /DNA_ORIENTATION=+
MPMTKLVGAAINTSQAWVASELGFSSGMPGFGRELINTILLREFLDKSHEVILILTIRLTGPT